MHSDPIRHPHARVIDYPPAAAGLQACEDPWSADWADALPRPPRALRPMTLGEFMARPTPPRRLLLAPILPAQGIAMLYGPRGVGKTHVALGMAMAVAGGAPFLAWDAPAPAKVLYIDGEMPGNLLKERLHGALAGCARRLVAEGHLALLAADAEADGLPDLSGVDGQGRYAQAVEGRDLIVVDNISTLCGAAKENEAEGWSALQNWALAQRRAGRTVLFVHHAGKGGDQRGTSRREDVMDTVIKLSRPDDYRSPQGARFRVDYTKARAVSGDEAEGFEAWLKDGEWVVTGGPPEDPRVAQVLVLAGQGKSYREIAEETGLPKTTVGRLMAKAKGRTPLVDAACPAVPTP